MDTSIISAMLSLNGKQKHSVNLNNISRMMNAHSNIFKEGITQKNVLALLCEFNPGFRPIMTLFDKFKFNPPQADKSAAAFSGSASTAANPDSNTYQQYIQYNNEAIKRR